MSTKEAQKSIKELLKQIDLKSEVIPFHNFEKFINLLEFLKEIPLNAEEKLVAKKVFISS